MLPVDPGLAISVVGICAIWASQRRRHLNVREASAEKRPGWFARRRALAGIAHKPQQIGIGYVSAFSTARLDVQALNHHGLISGAPGSGKTSLLRVLIQGFPGPVVVLDAKGSPDLAESVWSIPGHVWEVGSPLKLDLLDPEPAILAQQLLEGEIFTDRAQVYRAISEHAVQRAAWVLRWRHQPREPQRILELLSSPATLAGAIRAAMPPNDVMAIRWLGELETATATIKEAYQTFSDRLGTLLDSPVGRSLGSGPMALSLSDVVATRSKLLIRLDMRYGGLSRKLGSWALVAMLRLAAELRQAKWDGRLLFIVDEPRVLGHEGRHLADLFGTARDAGVGLVVADQGIAGLVAVHPDMPDAVMRSTAWQLVLRQGSADDAKTIAELFGQESQRDVRSSSDGKTFTSYRKVPRVEWSWLLGLPTGQGWLRVAPTTPWARERVEHIAVALPREVPVMRRLALPPGPQRVAPASSPSGSAEGMVGEEPETLRMVVERILPEPDAEGCQLWPGSKDKDGYARHSWQHRTVSGLHRMRYAWLHGSIPAKHQVHHTCGHRHCLAEAHLVALTKLEHAKADAERRGLEREGAAEHGA